MRWIDKGRGNATALCPSWCSSSCSPHQPHFREIHCGVSNQDFNYWACTFLQVCSDACNFCWSYFCKGSVLRESTLSIRLTLTAPLLLQALLHLYSVPGIIMSILGWTLFYEGQLRSFHKISGQFLSRGMGECQGLNIYFWYFRLLNTKYLEYLEF